MSDTYPYRYNFDAHMIQRANARGKVAVTCGNETRIGILHAWRPRRVGEPVIATSAGKRRGELRDMGLLCDTGFRGPTETGPRKAVRWGLTPAGEVEATA